MHHNNSRKGGHNSPTNSGVDPNIAAGGNCSPAMMMANTKYKTSMCRDLSMHGTCPRGKTVYRDVVNRTLVELDVTHFSGKNCTFAHSLTEIDQYRHKKVSLRPTIKPVLKRPLSGASGSSSSTEGSRGGGGGGGHGLNLGGFLPPASTPIAQVAPLPRGIVAEVPPQQMAPPPPPHPSPGLMGQQQRLPPGPLPPPPPPHQNPNMAAAVHPGVPPLQIAPIHPQMVQPPPQHQLVAPPGPPEPAVQLVHGQGAHAPLMQDHLEELQRHRRRDLPTGTPTLSNKDRPVLDHLFRYV